MAEVLVDVRKGILLHRNFAPIALDVKGTTKFGSVLMVNR